MRISTTKQIEYFLDKLSKPDCSYTDMQKEITQFEEEHGSLLDRIVLLLNHQLDTNSYKEDSFTKARAIFDKLQKAPDNKYYYKATSLKERSSTSSSHQSTREKTTDHVQFCNRSFAHIKLHSPPSLIQRIFDSALFLPRLALAMIAEFIASTVFLLLGFILGSHPWKTQKIDKTKPTWVLLHGKGSNWTTWLLVHLFFREKANLLSYNLEPKLLFSNGHSKRLEDYTQELLKKIHRDTGEETVHILGHSMGGILALDLVAADPKKFDKSEVVLVGSPVKGANLAMLQPWIAVANQLTPGSLSLKEKRDTCEKHMFEKTIQLTVIRGTADIMVPPERAAILGAKVIDYPRAGHVSIAPLATLYSLRTIFQNAYEAHQNKRKKNACTNEPGLTKTHDPFLGKTL